MDMLELSSKMLVYAIRLLLSSEIHNGSKSWLQFGTGMSVWLNVNMTGILISAIIAELKSTC